MPAPTLATGQQEIPSFPNRVIHLWVDPHYGNDSLLTGAPALNPNGSAQCGIQPQWPHDVTAQTTVLLHASWPFRTIAAAVGYRWGTTMLIELPRLSTCNPTGSPMDNKYLWYFGPPQNLLPIGLSPFALKPRYLVIRHLSSPPANYAANPPWWSINGWSLTGIGIAYYFPAFTDIQPYLVPDTHPWWHLLIPSAPANPIWQPCNGNYNTFLYQDPAAGVINPPGTHSTTTASYVWLDGNGSPTYNTIGSNPSFGGPALFLLFDTWCRATQGALNKETFLATGPCSSTVLTALRYSIEVAGGSTWRPQDQKNSNQQSFSVVVEGQ